MNRTVPTPLGPRPDRVGTPTRSVSRHSVPPRSARPYLPPMDLSHLTLDRDLVFFDLETTGVNVVTDRIVQFAAIKYPAGGGAPVELNRYVNPTVPIPAETTAIHGITDERVAGEPTFEDLADELLDYLGGADLAGYNLARFDVPLLMEEFDRVGVRFRTDERRIVDVQQVFYKMEPRTLAGALRYYRGEEMTDAHDALADVRATVRVLEGQLERYAEADLPLGDGRVLRRPVQPDVAALAEFTTNEDALDATNRLQRGADGSVLFNFGKHRGKRVRDVFRQERSYYQWIQDRDFSVEVKEYTRAEFEAVQRGER